MAPIYVVIYRILNSSKAEAAIKDCPAILLVSLTEAWVLMKLGKDFIQSRNRVIALQVLQFLLYGLARQLIVLALLQEMTVMARMDAVWKEALQWNRLLDVVQARHAEFIQRHKWVNWLLAHASKVTWPEIA